MCPSGLSSDKSECALEFMELKVDGSILLIEVHELIKVVDEQAEVRQSLVFRKLVFCLEFFDQFFRFADLVGGRFARECKFECAFDLRVEDTANFILQSLREQFGLLVKEISVEHA